MRKVLLLLVVFLLLPVTTYSLLPQESYHKDFTNESATLALANTASDLHLASPYGASFATSGDCAPQPATVCLLTLSVLMLFNRRIKTPHTAI